MTDGNIQSYLDAKKWNAKHLIMVDFALPRHHCRLEPVMRPQGCIGHDEPVVVPCFAYRADGCWVIKYGGTTYHNLKDNGQVQCQPEG